MSLLFALANIRIRGKRSADHWKLFTVEVIYFSFIIVVN